MHKFTATVSIDYPIEITNPEKFTEWFTSEAFQDTFFTFDGIEEILEHLLSVFDNAPIGRDTNQSKFKSFKFVEGFGYFYFNNQIGWSWNDETVKEAGCQIVIGESRNNDVEVQES